ncbi:serine/threonine-protein kinase [Allonocardiopsis opalescens]|uniref:serine/threonine-protein kinase n=1 Tax=Allonocardiopsis opalescens TaxID=1144618 RepID=UPI001FEADB57|nr:serine/threonine-protein kinase [Allonocardiopsis opalescens]
MPVFDEPEPAPPSAAGADERAAEATGDQGRLLASRYRLRSRLGGGGAGTVWRATDELLRRDVAVKELKLPPELSESDRALMCARATREARAAGRLTHPNVVTVLDVVNADGRPWIVMELLPARSLAEIVKQDGPLPYARVAEIGLQLVSALRAAHTSGIVHRDVKPGNVLIGEDGRAVLTDFGLATLEGDPSITQSGMILGSPAYIAPERVKSDQVDKQSDLWSLGATLYTAVSGRPPYDRKGYIAILQAAVMKAPEPLEEAGPLQPVLDGLLRQEPEQRLTAEMTTQLLSTVVLGIPQPDPGRGARGQRGGRRRAAPRPTLAQRAGVLPSGAHARTSAPRPGQRRAGSNGSARLLRLDELINGSATVSVFDGVGETRTISLRAALALGSVTVIVSMVIGAVIALLSSG